MNRFVFIFIGIASAFITYRCSILKTNRHDIQEIKWPKPVYDFSSNSRSKNQANDEGDDSSLVLSKSNLETIITNQVSFLKL